MAGYITFQSFYTNKEAAELCAILYENGVSGRVQKSRPGFYSQLINEDSVPKEFHVQISEDDLIKADNIIENLKFPGQDPQAFKVE